MYWPLRNAWNWPPGLWLRPASPAAGDSPRTAPRRRRGSTATAGTPLWRGALSTRHAGWSAGPRSSRIALTEVGPVLVGDRDEQRRLIALAPVRRSAPGRVRSIGGSPSFAALPRARVPRSPRSRVRGLRIPREGSGGRPGARRLRRAQRRVEQASACSRQLRAHRARASRARASGRSRSRPCRRRGARPERCPPARTPVARRSKSRRRAPCT